MKHKICILAIVIALSSASLFAQGLIWSEPVLMLEDTLDFRFGGYDAVITGRDSLLVTWLGGRDLGQGVRIRMWGPDGLSTTDELFTDRSAPFTNCSWIVKGSSGDIFVFGRRTSVFYCGYGEIGDWTDRDLPEFPYTIFWGPCRRDYMGRPWVFGERGSVYTRPTVAIFEDTTWSELEFLCEYLPGFFIDSWNIGDSTIVGIRFKMDKTFAVLVFTDSVMFPLDTIAKVDIFERTVNYFWTGDSIWYFGLRPRYGTTADDTAYMILGYGIGEDYYWDTLDVNLYNTGINWYPKFCLDCEGGVWAYWNAYGPMTPDSTRRIIFNRIARFTGDSWVLVDSFYPTVDDLPEYNIPLLLFNDTEPYPKYLVYEGGWPEKLWAVKCLGFANIEEETQQEPSSFTISAYPTPFNSSVTISLSFIPGSTRNPEIEIYDINGRLVAELSPRNCIRNSDPLIKGIYATENAPLNKGGCPEGTGGILTWQPAPSLPSGVYLIRARFDKLTDRGDEIASAKVIFLK